MLQRLTVDRLRPLWLLCFLLLLFTGTAWSGAQQKKRTTVAAPVFRDGDVVFQSNMGGQGAAIAQATRSPYTHCGIVFMENGAPVVWEAVGPVKRTPWKEFVAHGTDGHYVVRRPVDSLSVAQLGAMRARGEALMGRPYDIHFQLDEGTIYCSELVYKMYHAAGMEAGPLEDFCDMDLDAPIAREVLVERFGARVPCDAQVITPAALFSSPFFNTIDSFGSPPPVP